MDVFEKIRKDILSSLSGWIQVNDNNTNWTIEDFSYETGIIEDLVKPHCVKCVAVNQCWFKNEEFKKPTHFNYSEYSLEEIPFLKRGLYHPNCHCKEVRLNSPKVEQIKIIELAKKMKYAIEDKLGLFESFGYSKKDENEICVIIEKLSKQGYHLGQYEKVITPQDKIKYGFKINIPIDFPGKNEKYGKTYQLKSCYVIFPKVKLKNNTPIGGWTK